VGLRSAEVASGEVNLQRRCRESSLVHEWELGTFWFHSASMKCGPMYITAFPRGTLLRASNTGRHEVGGAPKMSM
jgi:hypothetical protein